LPPKKGDVLRESRRFSIARTSALTYSKFFFVPIEEVSRQNLKVQIENDLVRSARRSKKRFFYLRLAFLVEKDDGSVFVWLRTLPEMEVLDIIEDFNMVVRMVDAFVDEVFDEMEEFLMKPYVTQIYFMRYIITSFSLIKEKVRVRA
jgi:hypothetical protein